MLKPLSGALLALSLIGAPSAFATEAPPAPAENAGDEMVCKRIAETGSRVKKVKVCKTRSEWDQVENQAQDAAKRLNSKNGNVPSGQGLGGG